ncbi:unnamed protein product [Prorocentrum cordatum]|uniref:Uncharacterized protein n=1 Tax=Prorocentrum cordatum TaxID=2364126 RepID=A0ABN9RND3_9DINO|nr:unnamed protein product [Polarella glacialis]
MLPVAVNPRFGEHAVPTPVFAAAAAASTFALLQHGPTNCDDARRREHGWPSSAPQHGGELLRRLHSMDTCALRCQRGKSTRCLHGASAAAGLSVWSAGPALCKSIVIFWKSFVPFVMLGQGMCS